MVSSPHRIISFYNKSFTLIELLVVIAIVGLLLSIVFVALMTAKERAKEARMDETLYQVEIAANMDYTRHGHWSPNVDPNQCDPCYLHVNHPRFVTEKCFPVSDWDDIKWYCSQCCFDWQVLEDGDWVSIDVCKCKSDGSCCDVVRRRCLYDAPGGETCTSF